MIVRSEGPEDCEAIRQVNRLAFGREVEARLVDALRQSPAFLPELSLVAEVDHAIVGHVMFSRLEIRDEHNSVPALALATLAVLPAWQRQGVGRALVQEGLRRAQARGHRIVVVVGHPEYYPYFGFRQARPQGLECPFPVPNEAFMALALQEGALAAVRGTVIYPPAFDEV